MTVFPAGSTKLSLVDCDLHPYFVNGIMDLKPYMSETWQHQLGLLEVPEWGQFVNGALYSFPKNDMYINSAGALRRDAGKPGMMPASDPGYVAGDLLDRYGIDRAVMLGGPMSGLGAMPNSDIAVVIASAYNDWQCDRWLAADERYRGSILIAPQDAQQAAAEIERVADRPGIVAVHMPVYYRLHGERHYWPIYAAAEKHRLPILVHPGATESIHALGPTLGGVPTYYLEWHTALTQPNQSNVISLICHGVFEKFPGLVYVVVEGGFTWACDVMWRLDRDWKALRDECPWVKRRPWEYLVDHIRFTTQPFIEPEKREHVEWILDILHCDRTLLFSSDYPHWDFDDPKRALALVPEDMRQRIFVENALEVFGDRLL